MLRRLSSPGHVALLSAAILLCYLGVWLSYGHDNRIHNDFIPTYFGSWLLRTGHRADLYDPTLQKWAHNLLVGPPSPHEPWYPFISVPIASAIALPVTFLSPATAYTLWGALQLGLLLAAVLIAHRSAPRPAGRPSLENLAIVLLVLSAYATLGLLSAGQWDGLDALGVAMAYRSWTRDRYAGGAVWLTGTLVLAKPHLAIGLLAFLAGWGNRRAIVAAIASGTAILGASFALVGARGMLGWAHVLASVSHGSSVRGQSSFVALAGNWTGDGPLTFPITYAGTAVLAGLCLLLGHRLRTGRLHLGPALTAAVCLSLLAAPHAFVYDTVMLAPALTWLLTDGSPFADDPATRRGAWATVLLWQGATTTPFLNHVISPTILRVGTPMIWITVALAAHLWRTAHAPAGETRTPAGEPLPPPTAAPAASLW
jgi:Glycosyltransferase family 87